MGNAQLLVAFEDQSESYVLGFEAGKIWEKMSAATEDEIELTIHTKNVETIRRMTIAAGWSAEFIESEVEGWTYANLERGGKVTEKPNPYGIRLV